MTVIPHVPKYHVIRCNLILTVFSIEIPIKDKFYFYMHAFINSLFSLSCYLSLIFTKIEFKVIKSVFHVSCKHAYLVYKTIMLYGKNNNKYPCEFLLACIARIIQEVLLRLHNLEIWKKKKKQPIIRPNPRLKAKHPYPLRPFFYKYPHPFIYFAFPTLGAGANLLKRVCDHFHLEEVMPYL